MKFKLKFDLRNECRKKILLHESEYTRASLSVPLFEIKILLKFNPLKLMDCNSGIPVRACIVISFHFFLCIVMSRKVVM